MHINYAQHFSEFKKEIRVIEYASGSWRWLEPDSRSPFINLGDYSSPDSSQIPFGYTGELER